MSQEVTINHCLPCLFHNKPFPVLAFFCGFKQREFSRLSQKFTINQCDIPSFIGNIHLCWQERLRCSSYCGAIIKIQIFILARTFSSFISTNNFLLLLWKTPASSPSGGKSLFLSFHSLKTLLCLMRNEDYFIFLQVQHVAKPKNPEEFQISE